MTYGVYLSRNSKMGHSSPCPEHGQLVDIGSVKEEVQLTPTAFGVLETGTAVPVSNCFALVAEGGRVLRGISGT